MSKRHRFLVIGAMSLVAVLLLSACDWSQFRAGPTHSGVQPFEMKINTSNVGTLTAKWGSATESGLGSSSPAVANGTAYVGSGYSLEAFDAAGVTGCSVTPKTCAPLWTATTGGGVSSPAVANGVVYVGSGDHKLYAFDAAGVTGCSGTPRTCAPLWTATTVGRVWSSPAVANGVVYISSGESGDPLGSRALYAFDAAGVTRCGGSPKTCAPLWETGLSGAVFSSPAVFNGVVYVGSAGWLFTFDAATGAGLWFGQAAGQSSSASPAVANGVVYIASSVALYAFDAAGVTGCSGTLPKTCAPLWTAFAGQSPSSAAIANGVVYVGSDNELYAFDAASGARLWTATTGVQSDGGVLSSSPAVANGVVYIGGDNRLYAFDAAGVAGCSGTPKVCAPLRSVGSATGPAPSVGSSPTVANGVVYLASLDLYDPLNFTADGSLHAYGLP